MIRALSCAVLALALTACGSSGPKRAQRPPMPTDPALVSLQNSIVASNYLDSRYGRADLQRKRWAAAGPAQTGLSSSRLLLRRGGDDWILRSVYGFGKDAPQTTMADYDVFDLVLEGAASAQGLPVYRVTLIPRSAPLDTLVVPDVVSVRLFAGVTVPVRLVDASPTDDGGLRTGWTWCGSCLDDIRESLARRPEFADDTYYRAYNVVRYGPGQWRRFVDESRGKGGYSSSPNAVFVADAPYGKYSVAPTLEAALAIANAYEGFDAALTAYEAATRGWHAYKQAFAAAKAPGLNAQVDAQCELTQFGYRRGSIRTIREDQRWMADALREDMDCARRVARDYDPKVYFASYEAWQQAEPRLRERYGLAERQQVKLPDPATEVSRLNERMRKHHQAGKEKIAYGDSWIESMYRSGEAKRPGSRGVNYGAIVAGVVNDFARDMQQTQQRNDAFAASLYGMVGTSNRRTLSSSSSSTSRDVAAAPPADVAVAAKQKRTPSAQSGADDTEAEARREQADARRAEREAEAERRAAEREAKAAAARALKAKLDAVQPREGGPYGCVKVVDRIIRKGSSPHSSCSYSEPDRESSVIVFHNQCGFPVNAYLRFGVDTGGEKESGEYNIRPGSKRKTVSHCGMKSYEYWYEETYESVAARRDDVRASFSGDH